MKRAVLFLISIIFTFFKVEAQQPVVSSISSVTGYGGNSIEISGSGFSTTPSNLLVRFGAMKGTVVSSTNNFIEVTVPDGAISSSISVTNLSSGLTGYSSSTFFSEFPGQTGGSPTSSSRTSFPSTKELLDVIMIDLDGDGLNDAVATKTDNTATNVLVYHNTSTLSSISFTEINVYIETPSSNVTAGDIDGDGKADLVVSRGGSTSRNQIYVLRNTSTPGSISFAATKSYYLPTGHFAKRIAIRDLDLDGKPDVTVTNTASNEISIFENSSTPGNINLSFTPTPLLVTGATTTNGLSVEDLNNDGKPDIVVTQFLTDDLFIIPNESVNGTLQFGTAIQKTVAGNLNNVSVADLDLDGYQDVVVTLSAQPKIAVLLNSGNSNISLEDPQLMDTGANCWGIGIGDYVGNGKPDVIITASSGSVFSFFKNTSTPGSLSLTKTDMAQTLKSRNVAVGDLNGDAKPDLAFTSFSTSTFELLVIRNTSCIEPVLDQDDSDVEICTGQPPHRFNVAPAPATTFIWKKSGVEVQNSTSSFYDTDVAGSYTVTAVSESGSCTIESSPFTLTATSGTIPADPVASNNGPACIGSSVQLSSTNVPGATYEWTGPMDFSSSDQNPVLSNMTPEMAGTYYVIAKISPCESAISSTVVEVITPPDFTIVAGGPTDFCVGSSVTLSVTASAGYTYQWQKDGVDIGGATSTSISATTAGVYHVNVQSASLSCDLVSNDVTVTTFSPPSPTFTFTSELCAGVEVTFTNTTTVEPGQTPVFSWNFDDGSAISTDENPVHTFTSGATYNVTLTVDYQGQTCAGMGSQAVNISDPSTFNINVVGNNPFCEGETVTLEVVGPEFNSYSWSTGGTSASISITTAGNYSVDIVDFNGCSSSGSIDVTTNPAPTIMATADPETIQSGQSSQLEASGATSYTWLPVEDLDDETIFNPVATPLITTTYTVTGTDDNGCQGSAEVIVTVEDTGNKLPVTSLKAFSPNGDGIDDEWVIQNIENFPDCELVIFNRSGTIVYSKVGYTNDWDGRDQSGNELPVGAYFYTISCSDAKTASGSISIIR